LSVLAVVIFTLLLLIIVQNNELRNATSTIAELERLNTLSESRITNLAEQVKALEQEADNQAFEVSVTSRGADVQRLRVDEIRMLAGTVYAEAQGEPEKGKILVAKVVLNRLRWNPEKSMEQILHNPNQFATGAKYTDKELDAVYKALAIDGYDGLSGFHNPDTATSPEAKTHKILLTVGRHAFW
jgi:spore germination cell wall hydrolase CwlJ-like protein